VFVLSSFSFLLSATFPVAHASGCPDASPDWVQGIVDRAVVATSSDKPYAGPDMLRSVLDARLPLDVSQLPDGLARVSTATAGRGLNDASLAFGDVRWSEGTWFFHICGQVELAVDGQTGEAAFVRPRRVEDHLRVCPALPKAWDLASQTNPDATLALLPCGERQAELPVEPPFQSGSADGGQRSPKGGESAVGYGFGLEYGHALGPAADEVFASAMGGMGWVGGDVAGPFGWRLAIQHGRADAVPTRWDGWTRDGELTASHWRLSPGVRVAAMPLSGLGLAAWTGPGTAIVTRTITLGQFEDQRTELTFGGHMGGGLTWWPGSSSKLGIELSADGGAYIQRAAPDQPLVLATGRLGLAFGEQP